MHLDGSDLREHPEVQLRKFLSSMLLNFFKILVCRLDPICAPDCFAMLVLIVLYSLYKFRMEECNPRKHVMSVVHPERHHLAGVLV